jgi:predicted acyltransferase (DUF342 family)
LLGHLRIDGPVICAGDLYIGQGCTIKGPIVCEGVVRIGAGTVIGLPAAPTTLTASEIRVEEGVVAYGTVWARELGFVVPGPHTDA